MYANREEVMVYHRQVLFVGILVKDETEIQLSTLLNKF